MSDFICDSCGTEPKDDTLYEGWFKTPESLNPFAKGTVSAGLIQRRRVCVVCAKNAIDSGLACAKEIPNG